MKINKGKDMSKKANKEKTISKLIQEIIQKSNFRNNPKQVFDDIIQLSFNCLFSRHFQYSYSYKIEYWVDPNLINELTDYKKSPEAWELLNEASLMFLGMFKNCEPFTDILGMLYDEYLGKVLGQFLTPPVVAEVMASLNLEVGKPITENTVIGDTCGCGAGTLILGFLRAFNKKYDTQAFKHLEIINMDLDANMVRLSTIQIVFHCMVHKIEIGSLQVHWGNSLTEYNGKSDGSGTLAVVWNQDPEYRSKIKHEELEQEQQEKVVAYV